MKKQFHTLTTLAILGLSNLVNAQVPNWTWAKSAGEHGYDKGHGIATDASGNVFITGTFQSPTITFGTITLTNTNSNSWEIFIVKYDVSGNVLWAKSAGGSADDRGSCVATDASGNVFIAGQFASSNITFGIITLTNIGATGKTDAFIAKYDANGNELWARNAGGAANDFGYSIATDASSNVFLTGTFNSASIHFGGLTLYNAGLSDIFIVKYDASGNALWAKGADGSCDDDSRRVATDANGNVIITGWFISATIIFGTDTLSNSGSRDMFITKYDSSGNMLWAEKAGSNNEDDGYGISTDAGGNIFVSGEFYGAYIIFGTTTLNNSYTNNGDIFIVKYDASGNVVWAKRAGDISNDYARSVSTDASGNVFVTGAFHGPTITFGAFTLTNMGGDDIYIVKYDSGGNVLWAKGVGSTSFELGECISTDANGNEFMTGWFDSPTITFGTTTLTNASANNYDIFITKLDNNTTGIESAGSAVAFSVYPNPTKDQLTISNEQLEPGKEVTITITDITGKIMYTTTATNKQMLEVNTKDFAQGVYFVQVQSNDFVETRKVIVAR